MPKGISTKSSKPQSKSKINTPSKKVVKKSKVQQISSVLSDPKIRALSDQASHSLMDKLVASHSSVEIRTVNDPQNKSTQEIKNALSS